MSILTAKVKKPLNHSNNLFLLDVSQEEKTTKIRMEMLISCVCTSELPMTYSILKKQLPSIMRSKCFNENNYKFSKEVKNTEIGHLFEHIILEYLSNLKSLEGVKNPIYNGLTSWNWTKDPRGVFHIEIDSGLDDESALSLALHKSNQLLYAILESGQIKLPTYENSKYSNILPEVVDKKLII
ncbi:MAG TPA: hypothetical protein VLG67_03565 [Candidatus Saccharimonadales bacterium]|nr:hypothetical protein [Candidatus Saccharimonadales bacterium]